jgi:hypothetical protein
MAFSSSASWFLSCDPYPWTSFDSPLDALYARGEVGCWILDRSRDLLYGGDVRRQHPSHCDEDPLDSRATVSASSGQ